MKKKTGSLLAKVKALPMTTGRWIDHVTPAQRNELEQLRREYRAGKLPGRSVRSLYKVVSEYVAPVIVGREGLTNWLNEK